MNDPRTIQAAQAGDRSAQAALLDELADTWFRMTLALLRSQDAAREAVQETAARFLRDLPRYAGRSQFRTWAIGIALNVAREMRRMRPVGALIHDEPADGGNGLSDQIEREETAMALRQALDGLPERQREVVLLRYFEALSVQQAAAAMRCAEGTVKATLHQALRALRNKLVGESLAR